jgi:hypothetical protein
VSWALFLLVALGAVLAAKRLDDAERSTRRS